MSLTTAIGVPDIVVLYSQEREGEDESGNEEGEVGEGGEDNGQDSEEERTKVQLAKSWLEAEETDTSDEEVCGEVMGEEGEGCEDDVVL